MSTKQRVTCCACQKYFIITKVVAQIKCPECGALNRLGENQKGAPVPVVALPPVPHYSFEEASSIARSMMEESPTLWATIKLTYAGVSECLTRAYCLDKEKNEVFATRCTTNVNGPAQAVFQVYWNDEHDWDSSTVASTKLLHSQGNERLLHKEHKTTSAATLRNDVVVKQGWEQREGEIWCWAVSDYSAHEAAGWRRGHVVLSALKIVPLTSNSCEATFLHCFDFGGWIHVKFVEEEQKRVGLRLSKIKKKVEESHPNSPVSPASSHIPQQSPKPVASPAPRAQHPPTPQPKPDDDLPDYKYGPGVVKHCTSCHAILAPPPDSTSLSVPPAPAFCGNDGTKFQLVCAKCHAGVGKAPFCGECGNRLI